MKINYSISIVIPNYNGKQLLEKNIPYCYAALETSQIKDFEIIISDDNSIDDSVLFIKNNYPSIKVLINEKGRGFSNNANNGIRAATKELILILNSDVQLSDNYFISLLPYFDKQDTFGVMGKIIGLDSETIQDTAKYPSYSYGNINGTINYETPSQSPVYSFFMSGANALVDRNKLVQIGCFNELFNPYYWEDIDLGIRAWRMGYRIYYESTSYCRHPNSVTIKKEKSDVVQIISKRNKMYLHYLHLDNLECFYFIIKISFKTFFRLLVWDRCYMQSFYLFIRSIPELNRYKQDFKKLQASIKNPKSIQELVRFIKKNINHSAIEKF